MTSLATARCVLVLLALGSVVSASDAVTLERRQHRRRLLARRRLVTNGDSVGGCCACPDTTICYHVVSKCNNGGMTCCNGKGYDTNNPTGNYCKGAAAGTFTKFPTPKPPTNSPTSYPVTSPAVTPLTPEVAPYKLGDFQSNACAAGTAPIPSTNLVAGILCSTAAVKLGSGTTQAIQESSFAKPRGCSTYGGVGARTFVQNSGGSHSGALSANGYQTICTEDYAYNEDSTNVCPTVVGLATVPLPIARREHCETARTALGHSVGAISVASSSFPKGCYFKDASSSGSVTVTFNAHPTGAAKQHAYPICNTASDYSYGVAGANGCPSGNRVLSSLEACQSFARAALGTVEAVTAQSNDAAHPGGCYVKSGSAVWFNTGAGGGSDSSCRSVCTTKFAFGADAVNSCAPGDTAIATAAECQEAADALGFVGGSTDLDVQEETSSLFNKGCYISYMLNDKWEAAFNNHATGSQYDYATTICVSGTLLTTVTVYASTPDTAVSGVPTTFTFTGTKFSSIGLPWVKVVASTNACDAAGITGTIGQLTATVPATETTGTLSIAFDAASTATTGNILCWATTEAGVYSALANYYIAVTLPSSSIAALASAVQLAAVIEDGGVHPTTILALNPQYVSAVALTEVATIKCSVHGENRSAIEIVGGGIVTIDAAGVVAPVGTLGIAVRGVRDALQLPSRVATVKCTISTPSGRVHTYAPEVAVIGTNQPSYKVFCPLAEGEDPAKVALGRCARELTTNGNTTVVIIGGDCATCPQPPFSPSTLVTIAGVQMNTTLVPGFEGRRIVTRTPTIGEIVGNPDAVAYNFTFGYYNFTISSEGDATTGQLGRSIVVSSSAEHRAQGRLICAEHGLCPDIIAAVAGIYYAERCLGYEKTDGTSPFNWNSDDGAEAARFAFGSPSGGHLTSCRACPTGCRCPGGDRCRAAQGYFLPGEDMYVGDGLRRCHPNLAIAKKRCDGWKGLNGDEPSKCVEGSKGLLCAECGGGWYPEHGACKRCENEEEAYKKIWGIAAVFTVTFVVCFVLVAIVQGIYGNSIKSGLVRSMNFAGWVCNVLAMQAQIGRTAGGNQPEVLQTWYRLLTLFEFNPDGARPNECTSSGSKVGFAALSIGIALPLLFMLLEVRLLQRLLVAVGSSVLEPICHKLAKRKDAAKAAKAAKEVTKTAFNDGTNNPMEREEVEEVSVPVRRARAARARANTNRMEIELVMNPMGSKRSVESVRLEASQGGSEQMVKIFDLGGGTVANKRARLSELFARQRDTVLEAWQLDAMELDAAAVAAAFVGDDAAKTRKKKKKKKKKKAACGKKKKSAHDEKKPRKGGKEHCENMLGNFRKFVLSGTIFFHPLVVNTAFKSLYCIRHPVSGAVVLASNPGTECFAGAHWLDFVLASTALAIEAVLLPLFVLAVVGNGVGWCACQRDDDDAGAMLSDADELAAAKFKYGSVHAGVCLRCLCCVNRLATARRSFIRKHDKDEHRIRHLSYAPYTFNDYKPEFFYVRLIYVGGITVIAFCNCFLDPDKLLSTPADVNANALAIMLWTLRFSLCLGTLVVFCTILFVCVPNKNGSRWKMPLRIVFALLSAGMLSLNAFSWSLQLAGDEAPRGMSAMNTGLAFTVLTMSLLSLGVMALCFVIFVVFRGAKVEYAESRETEQEREALELAVLARALLRANKLNRAFDAWRCGVKSSKQARRRAARRLKKKKKKMHGDDADRESKEGARRVVKAALLREEKRIAPDGAVCTKAEFVAHYGGRREWRDAPAEERVAPDGGIFTQRIFEEHYGGVEWDRAPAEERIARDGTPDTMAGFIAHYGAKRGMRRWRKAAVETQRAGGV